LPHLQGLGGIRLLVGYEMTLVFVDQT
jgi:hypothetical protein